MNFIKRIITINSLDALNAFVNLSAHFFTKSIKQKEKKNAISQNEDDILYSLFSW